jgi:hypothetical protein
VLALTLEVEIANGVVPDQYDFDCCSFVELPLDGKLPRRLTITNETISTAPRMTRYSVEPWAFIFFIISQVN